MKHNCATDDRKLAIDRPCSACSAGDSKMEYHDHCPPFREACKCSVIAGNVVPNPECPVHVEVVDVRVAPSRSAAPPSVREVLEQQAAYYFSEIRKFSPLNLDHYSLENWKDFIVWREARADVPQAAALDKLSREPVFVLDHGDANGIARYEVRFGHENVYNTACEELAQAKAQSLRNEIAAVVTDILQARAAAVPAPGDDPWMEAAMLAQDVLHSIQTSGSILPRGQRQLMLVAIDRIQELWEPEIVRRKKLAERAGATAPPKEGK